MGSVDPQWLNSQCPNCSNWALQDNHQLLSYKSPPNFLEDYVLGGYLCTDAPDVPDGMIHPMELSCPLLKKIVCIAHHKMSDGVWNTAQTTAWLTAHAINKVLAKEILKNADNCLFFGAPLRTAIPMRRVRYSKKRKQVDH